MRRVTGVKKKEDVTVQLIPADMPVAPPDPESEFANPDPGLSTGLFLGSPGKRALWSIQDRDSGILIRDSGGAMSAGISCNEDECMSG